MNGRSLTLILFLIPLFLLAAANTRAASLIVTKTADTADGACDADCSLREAVSVAADGDLITFSGLFSFTPQTIALTQGQIAITRGLSIQGTGAALLTFSGSNLNRIFEISNAANVAISDLTISNGSQLGTSGDFNGGGIFANANSSLTITNIIFHHNVARFVDGSFVFGAGAAVFSDMSTVTVTNCEFHNNTAGAGASGISSSGPVRVTGSSFHNNSGNPISSDSKVTVSSSSFISNRGVGLNGGVLSISDSLIEGNFGGPAISNDSGDGVLTIDRCVIRNNFNLGGGRQGGGISTGGTTIIRSSAISGNQVGGEGGGIYSYGVTYIVNSSITGNSAVQKGGGIYNAVGRLYLTNSTVSSNQAPRGGGMYNEFVTKATPGQIFLTNSTIAFNTATGGAGGGILNESPGIVESKNSLISSNTATQGGSDVSGAITSNGFNLVRNTAGSTGWTTDLIGIDPMLAPLGSNGGNGLTHALLPGSPGMNAGSNALAVDPQIGQTLVTDQRGTLRILGTPNPNVDIGAFEANYGPGPVYFEGRLLTTSGKGLPNTRVVLTGPFGEPRYAVTNPFGYYRFFGLAAGQTYTLTASSKFYSFAAPLVVTADQNRDDLNLWGM